MPLSEGDKESHEHSASSLAERPSLRRYLIVRSEPRGLELFRVHLNSAEEGLPVFSSMEAAHEFLPSLDLGERWCVREFSSGELVSVLFAFRMGIQQVLLDPLPPLMLTEDALSTLIGRDSFVDLLLGIGESTPLLGHPSYRPPRTDNLCGSSK